MRRHETNMWQVGIDQGFPGSSATRICLQCRRPWFNSWVGKIPGERTGYPLQYSPASLVAQMVKNHPQWGRPEFDPWVGRIPLEKDMATHSSILAWRIPVDRGAKLGGLQSLGLQRSGHDWATKHSTTEGLSKARGWIGKEMVKTQFCCYWWTCLQGRSRGADVENKPMDTVAREGGMNWERNMPWHIYI